MFVGIDVAKAELVVRFLGVRAPLPAVHAPSRVPAAARSHVRDRVVVAPSSPARLVGRAVYPIS